MNVSTKIHCSIGKPNGLTQHTVCQAVYVCPVSAQALPVDMQLSRSLQLYRSYHKLTIRLKSGVCRLSLACSIWQYQYQTRCTHQKNGVWESRLRWARPLSGAAATRYKMIVANVTKNIHSNHIHLFVAANCTGRPCCLMSRWESFQ